MLRSAIISPNRSLAKELQLRLEDDGRIFVIRQIDQYPTAVELTRFVRAHAPQVMFLSIESLEKVAQIVQLLNDCSPGIQVVAVSTGYDPQILLEVMRLGIREYIAEPLERNLMKAVIQRVHEALDRKPVEINATDLVYTFLPAKAGVGTSTIALNTAFALSRSADTHTLHQDFDLNSGMVRFMLKLENQYCVVDAVERALDIDENFWPQLVTSIGNLDVLHAGQLNPNFRMDPVQVRSIVDFARRNYKVICADLSGNLEKYSIELMHESKRVFLVCTPEIPSLHLAREKYQYLVGCELGDRVSILLNRYHRKSFLTQAQIEDLLGLKVYHTFPNDYQSINRAVTEGRPVDPATEFGKQCLALAKSMAEYKVAIAPEKKRFIEFFSIAPTRYVPDGRKAGL